LQSESPKPLQESINEAFARLQEPRNANRHARRTLKNRGKTFSLAERPPLKAEEKPPLMRAATRFGRQINPQTGRRNLSENDLAVFATLLFRCKDTTRGHVVKSYAKLARIATLARSTIQRCIARLEAAGFLSWINTLVRVTYARFAELGAASPTRTVPVRGPNAYGLETPRQDASSPNTENEATTTRPSIKNRENFPKTEEITPCELSLADLRKFMDARRARGSPDPK